MKTLFISDLDGTLLQNNAMLSDYTIETINHLISQGMPFSVATARSWMSASPILKKLDLELPVVLMNGVFICDPSGEYRHMELLDKQSVEEILSICRDFHRLPFVYRYNDGEVSVEYEKLYSQSDREYYNYRSRMYPSIRQVKRLTASDDVAFINAVDEYVRVRPIFEHIQTLPGVRSTMYHDIYSGYYYLEMFSAKADKSNGVARLKDMVGIDKIVAFGDNNNDLGMLMLADLGIAVGNATGEAKTAANKVIGGNEEHAVAEFLANNWKRL